MKNYTKIPNEIFQESQLSTQARFLFCVLLKYAGNNDSCFPGQKTLAKILGYGDRYIRNLIRELERNGLVETKRLRFNKTNTYKISKHLLRNYSSELSQDNRSQSSPQIGSIVPLTSSTIVPPNSTHIKEKDKNIVKNLDALERCKKELLKKGFKVGAGNKQNTDSIRGGGAY